MEIYNYKHLNRSITLKHLTEGQLISAPDYVEKLKVFEKYMSGGGTYIVDKSYMGFGEDGLHYYKLATLIKYFSIFKGYVVVRFKDGCLSCEEV